MRQNVEDGYYCEPESCEQEGYESEVFERVRAGYVVFEKGAISRDDHSKYPKKTSATGDRGCGIREQDWGDGVKKRS